MTGGGVVAAGHPATAAAGAAMLRAGGNAVDAAVAAVLTSLVAEPLLTGLGAGGYLLVAPPDGPPVLLDFFVEAPGRGADRGERASLLPCALLRRRDPALPRRPGLVRHVRPARRASPRPSSSSGGCRWRSSPPRAAASGSRGVRVNSDAGVPVRIARRRRRVESGVAARHLPGRQAAARGGAVARSRARRRAGPARRARGRRPSTPATSAEPSRTGCAPAAGMITDDDLAAYEVVRREPLRVDYRGREVFTNPPPSAGGALLGRALATLDARTGPPDVRRVPRGDGGGRRRPSPHAACPSRCRGAARRRPARLDHPRLGPRHRRVGVRCDHLQRRLLRCESCPAPGSTSTTCSARRTCHRTARSPMPSGTGCRR